MTTTPEPAVSPAPDTEALRDGQLWSVLDWSLWGNGLGDVLRTEMADVMVAALTAELREQAEACIKSWHERRSPSMAVGVGTQLQRERDEALAEVDRLKSCLLGRRNNLAQLLGQPASEEDTGWYGLCAQVQEREAGLRADLDRARAERDAYHESYRQAQSNWRGAVAANMTALETIATLKRALAGHLFDGESVSTREAVRNELIEQGLASGARTIPDDAAERKLNQAVPLMFDLVDGEECSLDHHGYCQTHCWFSESECPQARAKKWLAELDNGATPTTDPAPAEADQPMPADEKPILAHTTGWQGVVERAALRCADVDRRNWNSVSEADRDRYRQYGMAMFRALPPHIAGQMSAAPQAPAEPTECKEQAGSVQSGAEIESPAAREDTATPNEGGHRADIKPLSLEWHRVTCQSGCGWLGDYADKDDAQDDADRHQADTLRPGRVAPIRHEEE